MREFSLVLAVACGGAFGAVMRYLLSGMAIRYVPGFEPVGTLVVNLLGCFLIGLLFSLAALGGWFGHPTTSAFLITGGLGSLTTFSTFGYQTLVLLEKGSWLPALLNVSGNLLGGLLCVTAGIALGRFVVEMVK